MVNGIGNSLSGQALTVLNKNHSGLSRGSVNSADKTQNGAIQPKECQTCKSRTYKDQSSDPSVSFQTPTHVSPEMAASAVAAHEQEHVAHNAEKAREQGMKANSTVVLHYAACPECGRIYVSGGTTTTTYSPKRDSAGIGAEAAKGNTVNLTV